MQLIQVSAGAINNDCVEGINAIQWLTENFPGKVWANSLIVLSLLEPIHSPEGGTFSSILSGVAALTEPLPWSGVKQSLSVSPKCRGTNASSLVRRTVLFIPPPPPSVAALKPRPWSGEERSNQSPPSVAALRPRPRSGKKSCPFPPSVATPRPRPWSGEEQSCQSPPSVARLSPHPWSGEQSCPSSPSVTAVRRHPWSGNLPCQSPLIVLWFRRETIVIC